MPQLAFPLDIFPNQINSKTENIYIMNLKTAFALYGLKWNPFSAEVPDEALVSTPQIESFIWRVESLLYEGGFALVIGEPGLGKSVCLRLLSKKLTNVPDLKIVEFSRPQSGVADFYHELGSLFSIPLNYHNHWRTFDDLRKQWTGHIEKSLIRPLLLIDEAQEMAPSVLSELRILSSMRLDSRIVLTVVLAGDQRLSQSLRRAELLPLASRIRTRLNLEHYSKDQLLALLTEELKLAGAPNLMTKELICMLVDHAAGNPRIMNIIAGEILALAIKKESQILNEALFFETLPARKHP